MKSKKGLETGMTIKLIIAVVFTVIMLNVFVSFTDSAKLKSTNLECNILFEAIASSTTFQNSQGTGFSNLFYRQIEQRCPTFVTKETTPKKFGTLVDSCWKATGSGDDFLPKGMVKESFCYYCGSATFDRDYSKDDFFKGFNSSVSKGFYEGEVEVLSESTLKLFEPKSKNTYGIFIYYERKDFDPSLQDYFAKKLSSYGAVPRLLANKFVFSDKKTFSSVTFSELKEIKNTTTNEIKEVFIVDGNKNFAETYNCKLASPNKNLEFEV